MSENSGRGQPRLVPPDAPPGTPAPDSPTSTAGTAGADTSADTDGVSTGRPAQGRGQPGPGADTGWAPPAGSPSGPAADTGALPTGNQPTPLAGGGGAGWTAPGAGLPTEAADGTWAPPPLSQMAPASGTDWAAPAGPVTQEPPTPAGEASARPAAEGARGRASRIPMRPLDVGDILDGTFGTIRRNPRTVMGLTAVLVTAQQLLAVVAEVGTGDIPTMYGAFSEQTSLQVVGGIGAVLSLLVSTLVGAVLTGMIVVVVAEDVFFGRRVGISEVWQRVQPSLRALALASLIAGVLPFAGLVFLLLPGGILLTLITLVVPGAVVWAAWSLTTPALVLERLGPIRALRRSWRLVMPGFWRVWSIRALSVLLGWVMQSLLLIPFTALAVLMATVLGSGSDDPLPLVALAFLVLGSILGGMIAQPFLAGVLALLYVDRRMRAEGLDIVIQRRARAARRSAGAGGQAGHLPATTTIAATGGGP